jgi:UDP-3-O-[3-hydroxymyristoyl] N-acetylglucosamine deacetylase
VRFHDDEPCRHELLQLVGALSLLGADGNAGLPCGHVVAFNADASLMLEFVMKLADACE